MKRGTLPEPLTRTYHIAHEATATLLTSLRDLLAVEAEAVKGHPNQVRITMDPDQRPQVERHLGYYHGMHYKPEEVL